jgi:hypothetical protein
MRNVASQVTVPVICQRTKRASGVDEGIMYTGTTVGVAAPVIATLPVMDRKRDSSAVGAVWMLIVC